MQTFLAAVGILGLVTAVYAFSVWLFMVIWNVVMPAVFSLPEIGFWYAAGIMFILGGVRWVSK